MKTNYEIRYAEHPDDVKSYDTKSIRCDFLIGRHSPKIKFPLSINYLQIVHK